MIRDISDEFVNMHILPATWRILREVETSSMVDVFWYGWIQLRTMQETFVLLKIGLTLVLKDTICMYVNIKLESIRCRQEYM